MSTDPCPPTPHAVPEAVDAALESHTAARSAKQQWDRVEPENISYRRIVAEYEHRLAEALEDRARLQEEMRAFGAYLRARDVIPEHVELCVREATKDLPTAPQLFAPGGLGPEMVKWATEGYLGAQD
jgi:hypothetical protein